VPSATLAVATTDGPARQTRRTELRSALANALLIGHYAPAASVSSQTTCSGGNEAMNEG